MAYVVTSMVRAHCNRCFVAIPVRGLPLLLTAALLAGPASVTPVAAQQQGYGQTLSGASSGSNDPASMGSGMGKGNSVLDSVNPIDLMNKIQRSQAMDEATPPRDAVDAALRDFAAQSGSGSSAGSGAAGLVKTP